MERVINTKFYTFNQNNSGGYFVEDNDVGVCETVIIEAQNSDEAWSKLEEIGDKVQGFWNYCGCCGERWSDWMDDGTDVPTIWGKPIEEQTKGMFRNGCFVHYYDGRIEKIDFKND